MNTNRTTVHAITAFSAVCKKSTPNGVLLTITATDRYGAHHVVELFCDEGVDLSPIDSAIGQFQQDQDIGEFDTWHDWAFDQAKVRRKGKGQLQAVMDLGGWMCGLCYTWHPRSVSRCPACVKAGKGYPSHACPECDKQHDGPQQACQACREALAREDDPRGTTPPVRSTASILDPFNPDVVANAQLDSEAPF